MQLLLSDLCITRIAISSLLLQAAVLRLKGFNLFFVIDDSSLLAEDGTACLTELRTCCILRRCVAVRLFAQTVELPFRQNFFCFVQTEAGDQKIAQLSHSEAFVMACQSANSTTPSSCSLKDTCFSPLTEGGCAPRKPTWRR